MTYDNTKIRAAMNGWLAARCDVGFGATYVGDLLEDFENWLAETSALESSPGPVVFGKELLRLEFEKKRKLGLTYWAGMRLRKSPELSRGRWTYIMVKDARKRMQERRLRKEAGQKDR